VLPTPLLMSPIFVFLGDVWIRTQKAAIASKRTTNLATHLPAKHDGFFLLQQLGSFSLPEGKRKIDGSANASLVCSSVFRI
jgi:hypothetical protein